MEPVRPFSPGRPDGRSRLRVSKDRHAGVHEVSAPNSKGLDWFGDFVMDATDRENLQARVTAPTSSAMAGENTESSDEANDRLRHAICAAVAAAANPLTQSKIQEAEEVKKIKAGHDKKIAAIRDLVAEGHLNVEAGPRGGQLHSPGKPLRGVVLAELPGAESDDEGGAY